MSQRQSGTPTWKKKEKRWRLRVQKNGVRREFHSSIPGRRGAMECLEQAEKWLRGAALPGTAKVEEVLRGRRS